MAIYHMSVKVFGRSSGKSACERAAYRSASKIDCEYTGESYDYTAKRFVVKTEIILPENAPQEYSDRSTLWNAVEAAEKSVRAQLAREVEVSIPKELPEEARVQLVEDFVRETFVAEGMIADIAFHDPPSTDDLKRPIDADGYPTDDPAKMVYTNPHAHILLTMRPIDENGRWEQKSIIQYICRREGAEHAFTAEEFKEAKEAGWQKLYRYRQSALRSVWLTPEEAAGQNLMRINNSPKTVPLGKQNPRIKEWNSKTTLEKWRERWAEAANKMLERYNIPERIDHRTLTKQGKTLEVATMHLGHDAAQMEKRAMRLQKEGVPIAQIKRSEIGVLNDDIKIHNDKVRQLNLEKYPERVPSTSLNMHERPIKKRHRRR